MVDNEWECMQPWLDLITRRNHKRTFETLEQCFGHLLLWEQWRVTKMLVLIQKCVKNLSIGHHSIIIFLFPL